MSSTAAPHEWDKGEHEGCGVDSQRALDRFNGVAQRQPDQFMEDYKRDTIAGLIERCAMIAEAIDSGRGNEKEIAKAIRGLAVPSTDREGA